MKTGLLFSLLLVASYHSNAQEGKAAIKTKFGGTQFSVFLGNIVDQPTDAIVVSHWSNSVNDGGGVGGAVASAAGEEIFNDISAKIKAIGHLDFTTVHPVEVTPGKHLKAKTVLNVIELKPISRLWFDNLDQMNSSEFFGNFPMKQTAIQEYIEFLNKYSEVLTTREQVSKAAYQAEYDRAKAANERMDYSVLPNFDGLDIRRNEILKSSEKSIGFDTVVETIYNALGVAAARGIKSVSIPTLGYGDMGDLSLPESLNAIATAVQMHQTNAAANPETEKAVTEVRVVVYAQPSDKNIKEMNTKYGKDILTGNFLNMAENLMPRWSHVVKRAEENFRANEAIARVNSPAKQGAVKAAIAKVSGWLGFGNASVNQGGGNTAVVVQCITLFQ